MTYIRYSTQVLLDPGALIVQVAHHNALVHETEPHQGQEYKGYLYVTKLEQRAGPVLSPQLQGLRRTSMRLRFLHLVAPLDAQDLSIRSRNGARLLRNPVSTSKNLSKYAKQCFRGIY